MSHQIIHFVVLAKRNVLCLHSCMFCVLIAGAFASGARRVIVSWHETHGYAFPAARHANVAVIVQILKTAKTVVVRIMLWIAVDVRIVRWCNVCCAVAGNFKQLGVCSQARRRALVAYTGRCCIARRGLSTHQLQHVLWVAAIWRSTQLV